MKKQLAPLPMSDSITQDISSDCYDLLREHGIERVYPAETVVFEEADLANEFYFVESGQIEIHINKYDGTKRIALLNNGAVFGEMAVLNQSRRTATAKTTRETTLLCVGEQHFRKLLRAKPEIGERIHRLISLRNEELALKESVLDSTGIKAGRLHLSIKGDPSLKETVFNRDRYESLVDPLLPELIGNMEQMLLERNVFRLRLNFNSGEIGVYTLMDPFSLEIHAANKLASQAYLDRHFPVIAFSEKTRIIKKIYSLLSTDKYLNQLSGHWQDRFLNPLKDWQPVSPETIQLALRELPTLRGLDNYYLRNFSINTVQDVIRIQFNCDGTHIVSTDDFMRFMEENT